LLAGGRGIVIVVELNGLAFDGLFGGEQLAGVDAIAAEHGRRLEGRGVVGGCAAGGRPCAAAGDEARQGRQPRQSRYSQTQARGGGADVVHGRPDHARSADDQIVGRQEQTDQERRDEDESGADAAEMGLEEVGGADAKDAAVALGEALRRAGAQQVNHGGKRHRQQQQADAAEPQVADAVLKQQQRQAQAAEKQDGKGALADDEEHLVGDERAGRAAEVPDGRVRIDLVAGPVVGVEAGQRHEKEGPGAQSDKERQATE
jgi:hypothetical protein